MQIGEGGQERLRALVAQLSSEALVGWPVRLVRLDSDGLPDAMIVCDPATGRREVARLTEGGAGGPSAPETAAVGEHLG